MPSQCHAQPMAMPLAVVRSRVEEAVFIMGQTSRCCMICLMPQSQVSVSFEYPHFDMFTLDRPTYRPRWRSVDILWERYQCWALSPITKNAAIYDQMRRGIPMPEAVTTIRTGANIITSSSIYIGMFSEVIKLLQICMKVPVSTASAERSLSSFRRLKTPSLNYDPTKIEHSDGAPLPHTRNRQYRLNFRGKIICLREWE